MKKYGLIAITFILLFYTVNISAADLIVNGGFETGDFTGWTRINPTGPVEPWTVSASGAGIVDTPYPVATQVMQGSFNAWQSIQSSTAGGGTFILYQDVAIPVGMTATLTWLDKYQMNLTKYCGGSCGTANYRLEILSPTTSVLLQTLYIVNTPTNTNTNTGWVYHMVNLSAYAGQTIRLRFRTVTTQAGSGPGRIEIDAVSLQSPTAADASVSGRVTAKGKGLANARVELTGTGGTKRTVVTNAFGFFTFDEVDAGATYVVNVTAKGYNFAPQVVSVTGNVSEINFTPL